MVNIKLKNLATVSILEDGVYRQTTDPKIIYTGEIDGRLLRTILKLNLAILKPLSDTRGSKAQTREIIARLLDKVPGMAKQDLKLFDIDIKALVETLQEKFLSVSINEGAYKIYQIMKKYNKPMRDLFEKVEEAAELDIDNLDESKLQDLVDMMITFNSVVSLRYSTSIYLCLMNAFYAIFTTLTGTTKDADTLVLSVLFSHMQRIIYDTQTDDVLVRYIGDVCCDNPNRFINKDQTINVKSFLRFMGGKKVVASFYPRLSMKRELTEDNMERMYNVSTPPLFICNSLGLEPQLDIFPYIFHLNFSRENRMRVYVKARILEVMKEIKDVGVKSVVASLLASFDEMYDHIVFPNREKVLRIYSSINGPHKRILNPNKFETSTELVDKLKTILISAVRTHHDSIRKQCVDLIDSKSF